MMKIIYIVTLMLAVYQNYAQPNLIFPRVLNKPKLEYSTHKKLNGLNFNCNAKECTGNWYPVINEEFNNPYDLPNKFRFNFGYTLDDDVGAVDKFTTWYGDSYIDAANQLNNHNFEFTNSVLKLKQKTESPPIQRTPYAGSTLNDYKFTNGLIKSLNGFKSGIFEARIKVPSANKMWPAYWLLYSKGTYAEIDVFEYYDNDVAQGICSTYNDCSMTFHSGSDKASRQRTDKYPEDINSWHTYTLYWDEFETKFFVDGKFKGYSTRFGKGFNQNILGCHYGSSNVFDFATNLTCNDLYLFSQLPTEVCLPPILLGSGPRPWYWPSFLNWPMVINLPCIPLPGLYAYEENDYPKNDNAMNLIISNVMNIKYKDDDWGVFSESSTTMEVDYVRVYQPLCCNEIKTICSLGDLENQTHNTDIITAKKITFSNVSNSCTFAQNYPNPSNWTDVPVICLATDEIAINGDAYFPGNTYAEFKITDCNSPFKLEGNLDNNKKDEVEHDKMIDQIITDYTKLTDSITNNFIANYTDSILKQYEPITSNEIEVMPNPASNFVDVKVNDEKYTQLVRLELVNSLGEIFYIEKTKHILLTNFKSGTYFIKFIFDKNVITKKIVKI